MASSMTGYGREDLRVGDTGVTIEIKSVNHRFLDFTAKVPRSLLFLEDKIKKVIQSYFQRGRIELYVGIEGEEFVKRSLRVDWKLMDQYMEQLNKAKSRYRLSDEIPITAITMMQDLYSIEEINEEPDPLNESLLTGVHHACEKVLQMRTEEGKHLINDVSERMNGINDIVAMLKTRRNYVIVEYRERIKQRMDAYRDGSFNIDDSRIHQEIALLAEKGDITEEITRLLSHIAHFFETIKTRDAIGRKLDFILQEIHRETNTIGAKSTDTQIGQWVVALKSDIEKIKEQVQNIE